MQIYEDLQFISGLASPNPAEREIWFSRLYEQYKNHVYSFLSYKLPPSEVADVMQETFVAAWRGIAGFNREARLKTWILSIARFKMADRYRKAREDISLYNIPEQAEVFDTAENMDLNQALGCLKKDDRELLHLVYNLELTYAEIGSVLQVPPGTVKSRMSRIRGELKRIMEGG